MWRPIDFLDNRFSAGVNLSNLGPKIYYIDRSQADPIPTNSDWVLHINFLMMIFNNLIYTLDFSKLMITTDTAGNSQQFYRLSLLPGVKIVFRRIKKYRTSMGFEYLYGQPGDFVFAIRTGFFYEDPAYGNRKFRYIRCWNQI